MRSNGIDDADPRFAELRAGLDAVELRIADACARAQRPRSDVTLVVVTKFFPVQDVQRLVSLGVRDVGENRHQEAATKFAELATDLREQVDVHFIGQLQSNKAAAVVAYADVVQSLDRLKLVGALDRAATQEGRQLAVTVQVDLDGEDAGRGGARPEAVPELADAVAAAAHLDLRGVMAVAPLGGDPAEAFDRLATVAAGIRASHPQASWISAGMSGDLEQAVAAGATHLRVGSAILGKRPANG